MRKFSWHCWQVYKYIVFFLDDWYCPVSDSEGFRFLLHNPLETPLVDEFASIFQLNKEIMVEVHPDMTNADDEIRNVQKVSIYN